MDHRCLYGHRVPEQFTFAITQRTCPTCGAPCVTLEGYRLARRLTQEVPLEALAAFSVVRLLEMHYTITARTAETTDDANSQQIEVAPGLEDAGATEPPAKAARPGRRSVDPADAPPPRRRAGAGADEAEREFFNRE